MAPPGDVTRRGGHASSTDVLPRKDGPIRQRPGAARTAATCQLRAHDHAGRTGPDHRIPWRWIGYQWPRQHRRRLRHRIARAGCPQEPRRREPV